MWKGSTMGQKESKFHIPQSDILLSAADVQISQFHPQKRSTSQTVNERCTLWCGKRIWMHIMVEKEHWIWNKS